MAALGLGLFEIALARPARAGAAPLEVHDRGDWGARRPTRPATVIDEPPDRIVVHHTATSNADDFSLEHAYRLSRSIQRFHMDTRGWNDTGQQLTISRGGHVMEGRNRSLRAIMSGRHVIGAQTLNHNTHTIGIENEGTYIKADVPDSLWSALIDTCTWVCAAYGLDPSRAIVGHRDLNSTQCPGDVLYAELPELRSQVRRNMRLAKGAGP